MATVETGSGTETAKPACPTMPRWEGDITGCGSTNTTELDDEGYRDCLSCGMFFRDAPLSEEAPLVHSV